MDISTDIEDEEETSTESDDDDYVPSNEASTSRGRNPSNEASTSRGRNRNSSAATVTSSGGGSGSIPRNRKRKLMLFEEESDSEDEMLVNKWKKAAKKSKPTKKTKSILKKTAVKGRKNGANPIDSSNFDPMSVLGNKPADNKSKLGDMILYIVAKNQVTVK